MKKIITIIALFFAVSSSFAQLKVTEFKKADVELIGKITPMGQMTVKLEKEGDKCIFTYRDAKFDKIDNYKSFEFNASDLDALYELFTNFEGVEKGDQKAISLGDGERLNLVYDKMLGKMYFTIYHTNAAGVEGQVQYLTPKQFKKLFGKKK
ncbi:hypothetical protein GCM10007424_11330 [Flavobacterium suaedae]|uniref:DUF4252 domain-containing protein n=1 Tax=Flavobacterium suaedae TaxID=1767027 RepID=A0ABQ1JRY4_9FLAO|nr:hypothetical protein [Flavobacterium suaedae]GGB73108.1 hypothetical protein GCM10007424_11330 [Flavobacterium suaedae]